MVKWNDRCFLQKAGICIGSCIAPIFSDVFLSRLYNALAADPRSTNVVKVFIFVDDYLLYLDCDAGDIPQESENALTLVEKGLETLRVTYELPNKGNIRFLDIQLNFPENHLCWGYEPRANNQSFLLTRHTRS